MIFECLLFHSIDFCVYLAMAVYFYSFLPVILVWNLYCGRLVIQPNDSIATFMRHLINFVHNFFSAWAVFSSFFDSFLLFRCWRIGLECICRVVHSLISFSITIFNSILIFVMVFCCCCRSSIHPNHYCPMK